MLEAAALECERGGRTLFRGLSFALRAGEALRVAGANGSGKTSLLRILCGLAAPSEGEVRWQGSPIGALRENYARHLVYLGHAPAVKGDLTATENLAITCTLAGLQIRKADLHTALERLGLAAHAVPVRKLSQGQRRRAALARLCVSAAPLWLLDEPFSALDAGGIDVLRTLVLEQLERGGVVVFTTHQDPGIEATHVVDLG
ncbi:MAG TPA: cytochrome c biogenesis heme-transporting ATPase CcmA [Burkholderiales bacterium]|nr:cytochrome c biogenesis heme-transporting ATPase CcmA [Burkholderiales bacterium]